MFCSNCGKKFADGSKFCPKCGTKAASVEDEYEDDEEYEDYDEEDDDDDEGEGEDDTINGLLVKEKYLSIEIAGEEESDLTALVNDSNFISESDIKKYNLQVKNNSGWIFVYSSFGGEKFEILDIQPGREFIGITMVEHYYSFDNNGKLIDCVEPIMPFIQKIYAYLTDTDNKNMEQLALISIHVKYKVIGRIDQLVSLIDNKLISAINQKEVKTLGIYTQNFIEINALQNGEERLFIIYAKVPRHIHTLDALRHEKNSSFSVYPDDKINFATFSVIKADMDLDLKKKKFLSDFQGGQDLFRTNINLTVSLSGLVEDDEPVDIAEPFKPIIERFNTILEKEGKLS